MRRDGDETMTDVADVLKRCRAGLDAIEQDASSGLYATAAVFAGDLARDVQALQEALAAEYGTAAQEATS
jgi:hypothetical protein